MSRILPTVGLLRSMSTITTFLPVRERLTARLTAMKLFPSPDMLDVIRIFLFDALIPKNEREDLNLLNSSAMKLLVPASTSVLDLLNAISPMIGILVLDSTSCLYKILPVKVSLMVMIRKHKPTAPPIKTTKTIILLGLTGSS